MTQVNQGMVDQVAKREKLIASADLEVDVLDTLWPSAGNTAAVKREVCLKVLEDASLHCITEQGMVGWVLMRMSAECTRPLFALALERERETRES